VLRPDLGRRDQFLLQGHPATAAATLSSQARTQDPLPQERRGQRPWADPHCPGHVSASAASPRRLSVLMLHASQPGWPLRRLAAVLP